MLGCLIYTPDDAPDMDIYYKVIPGQAQTFNQPEIRHEVEIYGITINDKCVPDRIYNALVFDGSDLESSILDHLRKQAEIDKEV